MYIVMRLINSTTIYTQELNMESTQTTIQSFVEKT